MLVREGTVKQRVSWTGILAGLLAGITTQAVLILLGLAIGFLNATDGLGSFSRVSTIGALWLGVSLAIGAWLAGHTAARATGYLTPAQGRFNGLLTGMLLVILTVLFTFNLFAFGINRLLGLGGTAVNAATSAGQSVATATSGGLLETLGLRNELEAITSGLDREEVADIIAENEPQLSEAQVDAATTVVVNVVRNASREVNANLTNVSALPEVISQQAERVQGALASDGFVDRLGRQGLTEPQAREVAAVVSERAQQLRRQATDAARALGGTVNQVTSDAAQAIGAAAWVLLLVGGVMLGLAAWGGGMGADVPPEGLALGRAAGERVEVERDGTLRDDAVR